MNKDFVNNRSKMINEIKPNIITHIMDFDFIIGEPYAGFIPLIFSLHENEKIEIRASRDFDPFKQIIKWIEYILSGIKSYNSASFNLDCVNSDYIISYEVYGLYGHSQCDTGIFSIYKNFDNYVFSMYCNTLEFLQKIYFTIRDFAKENANNKTFHEEWLDYLNLGLDYDEYTNYFLDLVNSSLIGSKLKEFEREQEHNNYL